MANTSFVESECGTAVVAVQGFRKMEDDPNYVFIGIDEGSGFVNEIVLTPENAHILSEEIRKHAEFANSSAEEEN